jgi:prepilin peptidase CpaA
MALTYLAAGLPVLLAVILLSAGTEDAILRTIANWKNALIALLAPIWWVASGMTLWPDIAIQIGIAMLVFAFFCGAFHFGQMGGGDVKLIGALALWFPFQSLVWMLIVMSLVGGAITLAMIVDRWRRKDPTPAEIPYGVAIAIAAMMVVPGPFIN